MSITAIFLKLINIGYVFGEKPLEGWRKIIITIAYKICCGLTLLTAGATWKLIDCDFDYSEFLGKDYKKTQKLPEKASMYPSNH